MTKLRCAIYTRKSTEEGLDQAFNSLDAQREACAAYILSQRHEGWTLVPNRYDDGGFTGGNMERPGLQQLLSDVKAGRVDVIVVYKVDRLTRALSDFAKIVEVLDAAGASFVSVTQAFNTTTSMGRLTLNVLLSFAQFEREVISERVRDKVAASKKKGMWMGGNVPLGYDVRDRRLVVNDAEAETVRHIMQRYVALGNVRQLLVEFKQHGITGKLHRSQDGSTRGGRPLTAGPLYHILSNRIYRGDIVHKGVAHPGEHQAIAPPELWDAVQARLAANRINRRHRSNASDPSLLAGMIRDGEGRRMTPSHASKEGRRYRYYVSVERGEPSAARPIRIAANEIEQAIIGSITRLLGDRVGLIEMFDNRVDGAAATEALFKAAVRLRDAFVTTSINEQRRLLIDIDLKLVLHSDRVEASFAPDQLASQLGLEPPTEGSACHPLHVPTLIARRGTQLKLVIAAEPAEPSRRDPKLVQLIVGAHNARQQLLVDTASLEDRRRNDLARLARLSFLAPDIVAAILEGRQPTGLSAKRMVRAAAIPLAWPEQRRLFGFG